MKGQRLCLFGKEDLLRVAQPLVLTAGEAEMLRRLFRVPTGKGQMWCSRSCLLAWVQREMMLDARRQDAERERRLL